ncbi:MAG: major capsid protein [Bdellovibrio sp.]
MAAKGSNLVTLADVAKTADKQIGSVAEVLIQENPMLNDIPYMEMNEGTYHVESIRSGLPTIYYRKANQAIPASKTTIEDRTFSGTHFESKSQMDEMVAKRGGVDRIAFNRWNQAQGHIQAMGLEHASLTIYGSPSVSNSKTAGLMDIYSTLNASEETSKQIVNAGGAGTDNCSILLVHWGEQSVFGVYPKGTQAGLKRTDRSKGGNLVQFPGLDQNGNPGMIWGYEEQFEMDHGLVVKDYRQAARIANIDVSDLKTVNAADLIDLMITANYKIHTEQNGTGVWYVNKTIQTFLHKQALTKVGEGAGLRFDNYQGQKVLFFLDKPVRRSDALLNSEAAVV